MKEFMAVAKALADENRVRVLMALRGGEMCVCQIIEFLGLAPSTVSRHMAILRQASLVSARKDGRWTYYRLADEEAPKAARTAIQWARNCLARNRRVQDDAKCVANIPRKSAGRCQA